MWSIVVAGGSGRRFGQLKQFALLGGRPVLQWAVAACRTCSAGVVLVVPETSDTSDTSGASGAPGPDAHGADVVVTGGATRADSVRRGLAAVPSDATVVLVHDAARPLASPDLFAAVIAAVTDGGADGAVPGVPPSDTIKAVDESGRVIDTLDRTTLVAVQTPQAFRADVLRRAHDEAAAGASLGPPAGTSARISVGATDDAMLVEALGGTVQVVPGEPANLKITEAADLGVAERLLAAREE